MSGSVFGDNCPLVVSPAQLYSLPAGSVSVLDASWHMPNAPRNARREFEQAHIPGARFLDLDEVASPHPLGLKHMMPSPTQFASACEELGISKSTHVVIYDTHGIFSSPRALFMFRAFGHNRSSILDGGIPGWVDHGCAIETGPAAPPSRASYKPPVLDEAAIREYADMVRNSSKDPLSVDSGAELVLDARPRPRYEGSVPEPRPGLSSGHIPASFSLPFSTLLSSRPWPKEGLPEWAPTYTALASTAGLHAALADAVGPELAADVAGGRRQAVASCGSGMTAGVIWLALSTLGVRGTALYDESWTGYAMREESVIEKGAGPLAEKIKADAKKAKGKSEAEKQ